MIKELNTSHINGLNSLPPMDWKFDYETFLKDFFEENYFYAFALFQDEKIIATGNVFLKGKIGWLANIIVKENYRGKGLGSKMTRFLVDFLNSKGCETQLLIATKLGEPVYKKIGFKKITEYLCFDIQIENDLNYSSSIRRLKSSDLEKVYQMDRAANAENRTHLIDKFYKTGLGYFNDNNELRGLYLPDFGRGLVLSRDPQVGIELLKIKHSKTGQRTLVPIENVDGVNFLQKNGFQEKYQCSRMILGKENQWNPKYIYSYGGGYCG